MSLDSLFKQNNKKNNDAEFTDDVSGEYRSRAEEDSLNASESSGRTQSKSARSNKRAANTLNTRKNHSDDHALPEKKRARRRLIGAVALVLAAVIGLPMVFDSEPKQTAPQIAIEIPSKDELLPKSPVVNSPTTEPSKILNQSIDQSEEVIQAVTAPVQSAKPDATSSDTRQVVGVDSQAKTVVAANGKQVDKKVDVTTATNANTATAANKVVATQPPTKPALENNKKPEVKAEPKKENQDDAAKALALLEGRAVPEELAKADAKNDSKGNKLDNPAGSFVIQVAALNSAAKIKELQAKLKAANINSYTQKVITKNGEVSRIRVGPFANKAEAEKMRAKLVKIGLSGSLIPN
ncbi:SPOR domain-containing protein [Undibacterium macrobrachii]|jgi:DedD protein|uniref:SPOR domain-containing protein n=1 Tax=Undibacterium macrobrachii TaxID=1119058 RepID=A0ABQ2X4E2_9BURK|nr:SPOR domain-containing protein [Undibacterium macrobrachii]GGW99047.1 hypothetical protein GCM10011282_00990 [Undibacterium macrobrachii]